MNESYRGVIIGAVILMSSVFVAVQIFSYDQPQVKSFVSERENIIIDSVSDNEESVGDDFDEVELVHFHSNHGYSIQYPSHWDFFSDYPYDSIIPEDYVSVVIRPSYTASSINFNVTSLACDDYVEISNGEITLIKEVDFPKDFFLFCLPLHDYVKTLWEYNVNSKIDRRGKVVSQITEVEIGGLNGYRFDINVSFTTDPAGREGFTLSRSEPTSFYFFQLHNQKLRVQFYTKDKQAEKVFQTLAFH